MKELILIEGLSKDELFTAIQAVVKDLLFFENETVTSLKVMEGDRINQYVVRPNRLCDSWVSTVSAIFSSRSSHHIRVSLPRRGFSCLMMSLCQYSLVASIIMI